MISLRHRLDLVSILGLAFVAYAGVSLLWSPGDKLWAAAVLASLVGSYIAGTYLRDGARLWAAFAWFLIANLAVALAFDAIPFGLFGNPNFLGCALALGIAGALVYRLYWFIPFGLLGQAFLLSRGAIFATGVTFLLWLWPRSRWLALWAVALGIVAVWVVKPDGGSTFLPRMGVWQTTLNHLTFFGTGFGSFFEAYNTWPLHINMTLIRPTHPYNDILELLFELGIGAIPLWLMLILLLEVPAPERLVTFTFLALGLTFYPLSVVPCGQLFALTLGQLSRERKPSYGTLAFSKSSLPHDRANKMGILRG